MHKKDVYSFLGVSRRTYFIVCSPLITSVLVTAETGATVGKNLSYI